MPLKKSKSPEAFKSNVDELLRSGYPVKQAIAIAYSEKRKASKKARRKKGAC